jgi:hypothetical protein
MWNISLYKVGSLITVSEELSDYKLDLVGDLVGVQEVRWEGSGTEPAGEYKFFYGKRNENHYEFSTGFCAQGNHINISFWLTLIM